ncbi:protocadherin beta-9-like [Gigantopelta aegis]|uniref:protocadherin beta-9-like n=1 Tax=Gigantopelta aegis TaxID=1735272 RepID=UPI001B88C33D|nr:protocadherin beta-9-like [Gigantopelta aegis]
MAVSFFSAMRPEMSLGAWLVFLLLPLLHKTHGQGLVVDFKILEEENSGSYVGSIASDSGLSQYVSQEEFSSLRYNFLDLDNPKATSLFSINMGTGDIYTTAVIDREKVCAFYTVCVISFDVTVTSSMTSFFQIVTVKVTIEDRNDNNPQFPKDHITLHVSEAATSGTSFRIEGAKDRDKGPNNSVKSYELRSDSDEFALKVEGRPDGTSSLRVVVRRTLDREKRDRYQLFIYAMDGGEPPLIGNLTVNVVVLDENDNAPMFSQNMYDFNIPENTEIKHIFGSVTATDKDIGLNGNISYRFSPERSSEVVKFFALDDRTGRLSVIGQLQYEAGEHFETIIEAFDHGDPPLESQAIVLFHVEDMGNNPPRVHISPVSSGVGDMILMSEGSRVGTVVAHIRVIDKDEGRNGIVACRSTNDQFSLHVLERRGYIIQLKKKLDRELNEELNISVSCYDSGSPSLETTAGLLVRVTDENDNPPVFQKDTYVFNLLENNQIGDLVGTVYAVDNDIGQNAIPVYFLNMDNGGMFRIDHDTGDIVANANFDRETVSEMTFTVRVRDEGEKPLTSTATVIVNIMDRNDNRPIFVDSTLVFNVSEDMFPGSFVGQLFATDDDIGKNAECEFLMQVDGNVLPFVVFSDGVIRTDRKLHRDVMDRYTLAVLVKDNGSPSLTSTARVIVNVVEANSHVPYFLFPNERNHTISVPMDAEPGSIVTQLQAADEDEGKNGVVSYSITNGNVKDAFRINADTGEIMLTRKLNKSDPPSIILTVAVHDNGGPPLVTQNNLIINFFPANTSLADTAGKENLMYIIIAGAVGGLTVVVSIIVAAVIIQMKRNDASRDEHSIAIQEQGDDARTFDKQLWHSVPADDASVGSVEDNEKKIDDILKGKMGDKTSFSFHNGSDHEDPYLKKLNSDQYGMKQFYTFRKCPSQAASEDFHSDTSGETTTSDSGRGGSDEDTHLSCVPEIAEEVDDPQQEVTSFRRLSSSQSDNIIGITSFNPDGGTLTFETFVPRNHQSRFKPPVTTAIPARDPYQQKQFTKCVSPFDDPLQAKRASLGKRVTFASDALTQKNLQNLERYLHIREGKPPGNKFAFVHQHPEILPANTELVAHAGSWYPRLSRNMDDDDNTTTSGSYTLGSEDIDEMFCDNYHSVS